MPLSLAPPPGSATAPPAAPPDTAWAKSFDTLLGSRVPAPAPAPGATPLAIEVALTGLPGQQQTAGRLPNPVPPKVVARLVQAGKNGGWIAGRVGWNRLDSLRFDRAFSPAQVRLVQEILAAYRSSSSYSSGYYASYGHAADKTLDLSSFESRQLWPLLDEASAVGLQLVYPRKLGIIDQYREAEFCLDITRSSADDLTVTPALRIAGAAAKARIIRFIGSDGHGVVYADPAETENRDPADWRFRLARLTAPVPRSLQQLAEAGQRLEVPAGGCAQFLTDYLPRLRQAATLISSDGSFELPAVSGPTLVLHADYRAGHQVDVDWSWAYQVGGTELTVPLRDSALTDGSPTGDRRPADQPAAGALATYRDRDAEQRMLADLELPLSHLELLPARHGSDTDQARNEVVRLSGVDTMRFTTEMLPVLADQAGVVVEVTGDAADYWDASESVLIALSTDDVAGEPDWFDLGVTITIDDREVPFARLFVALTQRDSHLLLDDGAYFSLDRPQLRSLARLIEEARALQDMPPGELRISPFQADLWAELCGLGIVGRQAARWQEQVQGLLAAAGGGEGIEAGEPPAALSAQLRPYQLDGFRWLSFLWRHQLGGILADDMGLGKTLQALALICRAREADPAAAPFLIVAPTSVVFNWAAEASRFTPGLAVRAVADTTGKRGQSLATLTAGADIVVTSYTLLRLDFDAYSKLNWSGLILDEAQYVKNHQAKVYQCARRLPAPVKLAITGTPLENNLMELWSLLSITAPGLFPSPARFRDYYAKPIEKERDTELLAQLQRRIRPLIRRRTKEQVAADLPTKLEQTIEVELHPRHRKLYQTHLQRERQKVLGLIGDVNANRFTIFRSLTLLRQLSLHAGLVDPDHRELPSAKIDILMDQLTDVAGGGHRALVFSQFTGFLGLVRERLVQTGIRHCYLDGSTTDRSGVVRRFKEGTDPVFLISLKAGGFGLNLTEADYCFLLDPWWNPATEAQAVDRTHRIGQTRNVMVYRLIAKDTIEEKVMALKARKSELFSSVLDSGQVFSTGLDADDLRGLFS